ncbi:hypothetical protein [Desertivirga xinjiangensis]|uniref:hypothetical protein n=1 Tax=Desertivirga xinjiangensis TaxID=539206 RepID=UPI00210CE677|nr:hypothetical protein [Pedobacter xinjiangensis]
MNYKLTIREIFSWLFGMAVLVAGAINTFWGNDPGFGIFLTLLSLVYFPPVDAIVRKNIAVSVPVLVKMLLGVFIIWASLGVGELFDKIDLMMMDL